MGVLVVVVVVVVVVGWVVVVILVLKGGGDWFLSLCGFLEGFGGLWWIVQYVMKG